MGLTLGQAGEAVQVGRIHVSAGLSIRLAEEDIADLGVETVDL